jgi:hypothetical protein
MACSIEMENGMREGKRLEYGNIPPDKLGGTKREGADLLPRIIGSITKALIIWTRTPELVKRKN